MRIRIGVDVGGTNTDAVIVDGHDVLAAVKVPTTPDITSGIGLALSGVMTRTTVGPEAIDAVMIGTTHFTNAVVERRNLSPTAVIRLGAPATTEVPPLIGWPSELVDQIGRLTFILPGGYEYDGREIAPVDEGALRLASAQILRAGIKAAAVTAVFSPLKPDQEEWAARILEEEVPGLRVTCSSHIGRLGLLERENATVINASLAGLADAIVDGLERSVRGVGIEAAVWMTQNDGTLIGRDTAQRFPAATFASGPTNSIRGAALLAGASDCIVIDIGGTTTDVGTLVGGLPREAPAAVEVGGVRTNFRMPDVLSVGLGGGSIVRTEPSLSIGPDSVGYRIDHEARVFGGPILTATDIAVAAGLVEVGDPRRVADLDRGLIDDCLDLIDGAIADVVDRVKTSRPDVDAILVGGGSVIARGQIKGLSRLMRPRHHEVANAVGASIAQVSGEVDRVIDLSETDRMAAMVSARLEAERRCMKAGADPRSIRIVDVEETPLTYLPSKATRLKVKAVGDLVG
jgi:N-methylhydantoinase A/oxoprolinase/acetone carboxylase beta subunit